MSYVRTTKFKGRIGPFFNLAREGLTVGGIVLLVILFAVANFLLSIGAIYVIYANVMAYTESADFWDIFWIVVASLFLISMWARGDKE